MHRILPLLIALLGILPTVQADELPHDAEAIRAVISAQLAAFGRDDAEEAFVHASPSIRERLGNAENFMQMVRQHYRPVYRQQTFVFRELIEAHGVPVQRVLLLGLDNQPVIASYMMEQQDDGSWRISGCILRPTKEEIVI